MALTEVENRELNIEWVGGDEEEYDEKSLVGRVISKTRLGLGAVRENVLAAWKLKEEQLEVSNIGTNYFSFDFKKVEDARRVLAESQWVVRHNILVLQRRQAYVSDCEIQINSCLFWIQLHNMPPEGRSISNYRILASKVGSIIEVEDPGKEKIKIKTFRRVRVEINVDEPLVPGFYIERSVKNSSNKKTVWIQVKYERLSRFCYVCGRLGHEAKGCETDVNGAGGSNDEKGRFDANMCAPPAKSSFTSPEQVPSNRTAESKVEHGERGNINCMHGEVGDVESTEVVENCSQDHSEPSSVENLNSSINENIPISGSSKCEHMGSISDQQHMRRKIEITKSKKVGQKAFSWAGLSWPKMTIAEINIREVSFQMDQENFDPSQLAQRNKNTGVSIEELNEDGEDKHTYEIVQQYGKEVGVLAKQVERVKLKRAADENWVSPIAKRKKSHSKESPGFAEEKQIAKLYLQKVVEQESFSGRGGLFIKDVDNLASGEEVSQVSSAPPLNFSYRSRDRQERRKSGERRKAKKVLFQEGNESSANERGGDWPSPVTKNP